MGRRGGYRVCFVSGCLSCTPDPPRTILRGFTHIFLVRPGGGGMFYPGAGAPPAPPGAAGGGGATPGAPPGAPPPRRRPPLPPPAPPHDDWPAQPLQVVAEQPRRRLQV